MKIVHKAFIADRKSAVLTPEYEAEVSRCTDRGERLYRQAQQRLAKAEQRLELARTIDGTASTRRLIARAEVLVEIRRRELEHYRRAMVSSPASAAHRGTRSFRPLPPTHGSAL